MSEFKLPNPKNISGKILGIGLLGVLCILGYSYLLPFLNSIVWGTIELVIGISLSAILLWVLTSKKFWKRLNIILEAIGELLFQGFIEMNPFTILTLSLDKAEKEREELMNQNKLLQGQQAKLEVQLFEQKEMMRISSQEIVILKERLKTDPHNEETLLSLETSTNNLNNAKDFIDTVTPISLDIQKLVLFTEKAYRKSGNSLKNAKNTVLIQKAKYEAVTAGRSALTKALKAFTGDPDMNKAATIALEKLKEDISTKVGVIRTTLKATSDIMNEKDLRDAAKVSLAANTINRINIDETFDYVPQEVPVAIVEIPENQYINLLK